MKEASPAELSLAVYLVGTDPLHQADAIAAIRSHVEAETAKLRDALVATNAFLAEEVVNMTGGYEGPAEPADELSSKAISQIAANNRLLS